ncbi:hypothetical protein FXN63_15520 [Pigmentiphaga aceris]|uniref:Uncharacterized protein n=1 Tax=Pigmentiphaga aceris TaxID=1940612 RepID=A0A5C0AXD0_9BURK|nr:hypothetical protein [Pigmentiphaga aceris]QEI07089.1 hypothetical protein FXN63_15520 [Pigmentiphaga aceris]
MNMRLGMIAAALLSMAALSPAHAQRQGNTQWAANAPGSSCKVWGPSMLISAGGDQSDYLMRYQGACKDGVANGAGTATWLYRWVDGKVHSTWKGNFVNGIFVGQQPVRSVTGMPGDRFLIPLEGTAPRVLLLSRSEQTGALDMCKIEKVFVEAGTGPNALDLENDDATKAALSQAVDVVRKQCPQAGRLSLEVYAGPIQPDANGRIQNPLVTAAVREDDSALASYNNRNSDAKRRAVQTAARAEQDAVSRTRFMDFSRRHALSTWALSSQLDENPFLFSGQRVGLMLQLERMVSPNQAIVRDLRERAGGSLLLTGITPETFRGSYAVVAATVAPQRAKLENTYRGEITEVQAIEALPCADRYCQEWTGWMRLGEPLAWGKPMRWD